jgi:hypothetical protein
LRKLDILNGAGGRTKVHGTSGSATASADQDGVSATDLGPSAQAGPLLAPQQESRNRDADGGCQGIQNQLHASPHQRIPADIAAQDLAEHSDGEAIFHHGSTLSVINLINCLLIQTKFNP